MDAEDERGEARAPQQWGASRDTAGDEKPASHEIEDDGVHRVNEHVAQVVAPRIHSTERVVEPERHPGERDVVPHQGLRPHPPELGPAQSPETLIAEEVDIVIPVEELAVERGQEADEHSGEDEHRDNALQEPHTTDTALATATESRNGHPSPPRQVQHNADGHHAESTEAHQNQGGLPAIGCVGQPPPHRSPTKHRTKEPVGLDKGIRRCSGSDDEQMDGAQPALRPSHGDWSEAPPPRAPDASWPDSGTMSPKRS